MVKFDNLLSGMQIVEDIKSTEKEIEIVQKYKDSLDPKYVKEGGPKYQKEIFDYRMKNGMNSFPNMRIINMMQNQKRIIDSSLFEDIYSKFYPELSVIESGFATFPYNSFYAGKDKNDKAIFKPDNARYERMIKNIPFFEIIEENQKFILDSYLPYAQMKKAGTLTNEDVQKFNESYKAHLENQKKYAAKLKTVGIDHPDIKDLQPFHSDPRQNFAENWKGGRLAGSVLKTAEDSYGILERGWPVEDISVINRLFEMEADLKVKAKKAGLSSADKKKAAELLQKIEPSMKRLKTEYVLTSEMRDDILDSFKQPVNDYFELDKKIVLAKNPEQEYIGRPIKDIFNEAADRKVLDSEIGKVDIRLVDNRPNSISDDAIVNNVKIMVDDLHAVEVKMFGSPEFKEMKEYLEDLNKYVDRAFVHDRMALGDGNPDKGYVESLKILKSKASNTLERVKSYLDHKEVDFNEDRQRRDKKGKQGTEQSRIKMAIKTYDKLGFMIDQIQEYVDSLDAVKTFEKNELPQLKKETKDILFKKIQAEDANIQNLDLSNMTKEVKHAYITSVGRIAVNYLLMQNSNFTLKNETPDEFRARMINNQTKNLTYDELKTMAKTDRALRGILSAEEQALKKPDFVKKDSTEIIADIRTKIHDIVQQNVSESQIRKQNSEYYKDKLVSTQKKQARQLKEQEKADHRNLKNGPKA
jgi:hypothetical protein